MLFILARRLVGARIRPTDAQEIDDGTQSAAASGKGTVLASAQRLPDWQAVLTAPIDQLCETPSADTVRYAYDLYADAVYAPFAAREARMAVQLAEIRAGFAALAARAPDLVEAALAEHPQVFADLRRLRNGGR